MNLTDPKTLRKLLERHGLSPTKRWGQHFLISPKVVQAILDSALPAAGVLEIGPGPGVLTQTLSERVEKLIAVEIDPIAVSALAESAPRAEVTYADALEADLGGLFDLLPEPRVLVSNMPYNITGLLLGRFTDLRSRFERAVLMMQREVGMKIVAQAGDRTAGALSIVLQSYFEIDKVIDAPGGAFYPPPKVDSVVLRLVPRQSGGELGPRYEKFVHGGFRQPRKTLANNLSGFVDRERLMDWCKAHGLPESVRPHQVSVEQWQDLYRTIQ